MPDPHKLPNPYTQAALTRVIKAAMKAGLKITGVRPDGTVLTEMPDEKRQSTGGKPVDLRLKLRDARDRL